MADPIRWQILDTMIGDMLAMSPQKTELVAGYIHIPDEVASITPPIHEYLNDRAMQTQTVYALWVEDSDTTERTSGRKDKTMRVFIQAARRYMPAPAAADPFKQRNADQDPEEKVRSELAHDIERFIDLESTIGKGDQLGDLYDNWEYLGDDTFQVTTVRCPGWTMLQVETQFSFHTRLGEPSEQAAP